MTYHVSSESLYPHHWPFTYRNTDTNYNDRHVATTVVAVVVATCCSDNRPMYSTRYTTSKIYSI